MRAALGAVGMSEKSVVSWLDSNGLIKKDPNGKSTIVKRIKGTRPRCYALTLPFGNDDLIDFDEII